MADKYFITGDIVSADAPNYGEKRVEIGGSSALIIDMEVSESTITLKEKSKVIYDAYANGGVVRGKMTNEHGVDYCSCITASNDKGYQFVLWCGQDLGIFESANDNDFPSMDISG